MQQNDPSAAKKEISPRIRRAVWMGRLAAWVLPLLMILVIPAALGMAIGVSRGTRLVLIGAGTLLYAAYYRLACAKQWDHMFFAIRLAHRVREIPEEIDWKTVNRLDMTAVPGMYAILGLGLIVLGLFT